MNGESAFPQFGSYRRFPVRESEQDGVKDERQVCGQCLSGACCSSEGPIAMTAFDILRLAVFFDMTPADFLLTFTQDGFGGEDEGEQYRSWIDHPDSSVVTYLRRRANHATSPCIFLKYIQDGDGTPRRVCSVHAARPLACREYYYDTCKKRWTGELAVVQAEGLEMIRDRKITQGLVDANRTRLEPVLRGNSLAKKWQYAFWSEMRRALDVEAANNEGANSYPIANFQDPIDQKLNRLISSRHLRFEEKYGPQPHDEQLQSYSAGLSFKGSAEHRRLLRIVATVPASDMFSDQDYPHYVGIRTLMPGVRMAERFGRAQAVANDRPYAHAIARGWDFLIGLAGHSAAGQLLELEPSGTLELALLDALLPFNDRLQRQVAGTPCLAPAKRWASGIVCRLLEGWSDGLAAGPSDRRDWMRLYCMAARYDSQGVPRNLRRVAQLVRTKAARYLPSAWWQHQIVRWLRALRPRRTREARSRPIDSLSELQVSIAIWPVAQSARICAAVGTRLEQMPLSATDPSYAFDALDLFARAIRCWSPLLRHRGANLALGWAAYLEEAGLWTNALLLQWPGLCATLEIAGPNTPGFDRAIEHALASQSADGSWGADLPPGELPGWQDSYLIGTIKATSKAVDGLCLAL